MPHNIDKTWRSLPWIGLAILVLAAGCSGSKVALASVTGKVTLNDKPLAGVVVWFYPEGEGEESQTYGKGTTDASGTYRLSTREGKNGAVVGKNRVVVNWPPHERGDGKSPPPPPPGPRIPLPYTVATNTPLHVEVKAGEAQTINLELTASRIR